MPLVAACVLHRTFSDSSFPLRLHFTSNLPSCHLFAFVMHAGCDRSVPGQSRMGADNSQNRASATVSMLPQGFLLFRERKISAAPHADESGPRPASGSPASVSRSRPSVSPRMMRWYPAQAIIAALSVQSPGGGYESSIPRRPHSSRILRFSPEFAATPPPRATRLIPVRSTAAMVVLTSISTTAAWKPAAISPTRTSFACC